MGLDNFLKSCVDTKVLCEETIKKQVELFEKYRRENPKEDQVTLLANVYLCRMASRKINVDEDLETSMMVAYGAVYLHSLLPPPDCARALGLFILFEERRDLIIKHPEYTREYNKLMGDIMQAHESKNTSYINKLNKKYNPKMFNESTRE